MEAKGLQHFDKSIIAATGKRLRQRGMHKRAIVWYTLALQQYPDDLDFLRFRGLSNLAIDNARAACADYVTLCDLQSSSPPVKTLVMLGKIRLMHGEMRLAREIAETVLSRDDRTPEDEGKAGDILSGAERLADLLVQIESAKDRNDVKTADLLLTSAMKICKGACGPNWMCWKAEVDMMWKPVESLIMNSRELARETTSSRAQYVCALLAFMQGEIDEAIDCAARAVGLETNQDETAANLLGQLEIVKAAITKANQSVCDGEYEDAIGGFDEALSAVDVKGLNMRHGWLHRDIWNEMAKASLKGGALDRLNAASGFVYDALQIDPSHYKLLWTRAAIDFAQGQFEEAWSGFGLAQRRAAAEHSVDGDQDVEMLRDQGDRAYLAMRRGTAHDYYAILGLKPEADDNQIKRAWRDAILHKHSDKGGTDEAFKLLKEAYDVLINATSRAKYDGVDEPA